MERVHRRASSGGLVAPRGRAAFRKTRGPWLPEAVCRTHAKSRFQRLLPAGGPGVHAGAFATLMAGRHHPGRRPRLSGHPVASAVLPVGCSARPSRLGDPRWTLNHQSGLPVFRKPWNSVLWVVATGTPCVASPSTPFSMQRTGASAQG